MEGCDELQGYLFSTPQPVMEVVRLLGEHGHAGTADRSAARTAPSRAEQPQRTGSMIQA